MSTTIDNIAKKILTNKIDRREALNGFEELSDEDKEQLIAKLKFKLTSEQNRGIKNHEKVSQIDLLQSVSERNLQENHEDFIAGLAKEYENFAPKSKENALKHQEYFVDQRKISNLKKCLKSIQYHLTYEKAEGAYLFDIDGNKYVDITGDNGVNIFGHQAPFINKAIETRLNKGFPLVGYTEELFEAAKLFCELTNHERVLFTQSGTEAVMWAVRIARAATQKKKIVIFEGAYHGLSDAVVAVKDPSGKSYAAGLGMLQEFADQLIILDYGKMSELETIIEHSNEIAAVLVEPVQSRNPNNQPLEFLKEVRKITLEKNIPLIFDEMITGFRICPKGAQGHFNIQADIATYGKVPGGGMPTGMIAGVSKYMDYADGGTWRFDDDSMPSLRRTLMAGTHTRNPVKIAATLATLKEIKRRCSGKLECESCTCFQKELNQNTSLLTDEINTFFESKRLPITTEHFGSLFRFSFYDDPNGLTSELFLILLRMNGVETSVSGNFFLTTAHTKKDLGVIVKAIKASVEVLIKHRFFTQPEPKEIKNIEVLINANEIESAAETKIAKRNTNTTENFSNQQMIDLKNLIRADLESFQDGDY